MVKKCIVCKKTYFKGCNLSFHQVPVDMERRVAWSLGLGIEFPKTSFTHVCSDHFAENDFTIGNVTVPSGETVCRKQLRSTATPRMLQEIIALKDRFPADPLIRNQWYSIVGVAENERLPKIPHICSDHFDPQDIALKPNGHRIIKPGSLPVSDPVFLEPLSDSSDCSSTSTPPRVYPKSPDSSRTSTPPSVYRESSDCSSTSTPPRVYPKSLESISEVGTSIEMPVAAPSGCDISPLSDSPYSDKEDDSSISDSVSESEQELNKYFGVNNINQRFKIDTHRAHKRVANIQEVSPLIEEPVAPSATISPSSLDLNNEDNSSATETTETASETEHELLNCIEVTTTAKESGVEGVRNWKPFYTDELEISDFDTPKKRRKNVCIIKKAATSHRKTIHKLQKRARRLNIKISSLQVLLKTLKEK